MINQTKFTVKKPQQPGSQQKNTEPFNSHKPQITNHRLTKPFNSHKNWKNKKKTQQAVKHINFQIHKFISKQFEREKS